MARPKPRTDRNNAAEPSLVHEIRSAIDDSGLSHYHLAKDSRVDEASVRRFLSRERSLSLDSAGRIFGALGLKVVRPARWNKALRREPAPKAQTSEPEPETDGA